MNQSYHSQFGAKTVPGQLAQNRQGVRDMKVGIKRAWPPNNPQTER